MRALAIRHVLAEHLGIMERSLRNLGFKVEYLDTAKGETLKEPLEEYSLLVVLGGYMGAYEENLFELPKDAVRVYSSEKYENQAFVYGKAVGL